MFRPIHRLRCKFDEPYRIRIGVGLSPIRNQRELKALIAFCEEALKDKKHMRLNPERRDIYEQTVRLYKEDDPHFIYFVSSNCGWYWS